MAEKEIKSEEEFQIKRISIPSPSVDVKEINDYIEEHMKKTLESFRLGEHDLTIWGGKMTSFSLYVPFDVRPEVHPGDLISITDLDGDETKLTVWWVANAMINGCIEVQVEVPAGLSVIFPAGSLVHIGSYHFALDRAYNASPGISPDFPSSWPITQMKIKFSDPPKLKIERPDAPWKID